MFDISRKYRTRSSLNDSEVKMILQLLEKELYGQTTEDLRPLENCRRGYAFLDFGCHLGHLSIELALRYPIIIFAVDNFIGTPGDKIMAEEIYKYTKGQTDFYKTLISNINEVRNDFKGHIIVLRVEDFFKTQVHIDFAFIDSSHKTSDEFLYIDNLLYPGGILGGHDNQKHNPDTAGVTEGIKLIQDRYTWILNSPIFFMMKR
jgi:hypothetical protein